LGTRSSRAAVPGAVLSAGLKGPPIFEGAVLHRHRRIVLLDAPPHLLEQCIDQRPVRLHRRFEIGILGLQIVEHVLVIDLGIARVAQPRIRVLHLYAVALVAVGALLGARRGRQVCGFRHRSSNLVGLG
jgi:hypothetical protein